MGNKISTPTAFRILFAPRPISPCFQSGDTLRLAIAAALLGVTLSAGPSLAQHASAIVEDVRAPSAGVSQFEYVMPGRVIDLGSDGSLTLGYLGSCERERIEGGRVTVGNDQSNVQGGVVKRLKIACDGGSFQLTEQQSQQSLVAVFRDYDANKDKHLPAAQVRLYGTSPLVTVAAPGGVLEIHRIDRVEQPITVPLDRTAVDLATLGISLTPGGLYQAKAQGRGVTFKIDAAASDGVPVLSRLLRI
jgi:hypothetical protein